MKIAILHNFAEHPGGGDLIMLDIIEALIEHNHSVTLITSYPQGLPKAIEHFSKDNTLFTTLKINKVKVPSIVKHPYNIYLTAKNIEDQLKKYDLIVISDDIPKPLLNSHKVLVYANYPHAARIKLNELIPFKYRNTFKGKIVWKLHNYAFKHFFLLDWNHYNIHAIANSTLTQKHIIKALKPKHMDKIYPPVQTEKIAELAKKTYQKDDLIVYIGRIQPEKGIEDLIKAIATLKHLKLKAEIMGFLHSHQYFRKIKQLIERLDVKSKIEVIPNAPRNEILRTLLKAKAIVHPAYYEPFGIAVVEGMAASCIPIVRRGFNGPWLDIIEEGKYGFGFSNIKELAEIIEKIIKFYDGLDVKAVTSRALEFDRAKFKQKFVNILRRL